MQGIMRLAYTLKGFIKAACIPKGFMKVDVGFMRLILPFLGFNILRLFFTVQHMSSKHEHPRTSQMRYARP